MQCRGYRRTLASGFQAARLFSSQVAEDPKEEPLHSIISNTESVQGTYGSFPPTVVEPPSCLRCSRSQCTLPSVGLQLLPGCRCLLPPLVAAAGIISRGDCTSASNQGGPWSSELLARTSVPERPPLSFWFLLFWEGSGTASEPVLKALHFWLSDLGRFCEEDRKQLLLNLKCLFAADDFFS